METEDVNYRSQHHLKLKYNNKAKHVIQILKASIGKPHSHDCPNRNVLNLLHNMEVKAEDRAYVLTVAQEVYDSACDHFGGTSNPRTVYAAVLLGEAYLQAGQPLEAHRHLRWALQVLYFLRKPFSTDCPIILTLLCVICAANLGRIYRGNQDAMRSSKFYKLAIELMDKPFQDVEPHLASQLLATCHFELGCTYKLFGCFAQSLYYLKRSTEVSEEDDVQVELQICEVLVRLNRFTECKEVARSCLSKLELEQNKRDILRAEAKFFIAVCLHLEFKIDDAITHLRNAIQLRLNDTHSITVPEAKPPPLNMETTKQNIDNLITNSPSLKNDKTAFDPKQSWDVVSISSWYCQLAQFYTTKAKLERRERNLNLGFGLLYESLELFLQNCDLLDVNCVPILLHIGEFILNQDIVNPTTSVLYYDAAVSICRAELPKHSPYVLYCEQARAYSRFQLGHRSESKVMFKDIERSFNDFFTDDNNAFSVMASVYFKLTFAACVLRDEQRYEEAFDMCSDSLKKYALLVGYDGASVANMYEEIAQYSLLTALHNSSKTNLSPLLKDPNFLTTFVQCVNIEAVPDLGFNDDQENVTINSKEKFPRREASSSIFDGEDMYSGTICLYSMWGIIR
eukprot:g4140.t1